MRCKTIGAGRAAPRPVARPSLTNTSAATARLNAQTRALAEAQAAAGYDEEVFCSAALAAMNDAGVRASLAKIGHRSPDDVGMNFVVFMLRSGRWKLFDPARARVIQFVVDFLLRYARWQLSNRHEARSRRARGFGDDEVVRSRPRRDVPDDADRLAKAVRIARGLCRDDDVAVFEAFLATGSVDGACGVTGETRQWASSAIRRVCAAIRPYVPSDRPV